MVELRQSDFDAFMLEVTGYEPFPWQRRLLATVLTSGWPRLLDLPTGSGKTSTLLIALFALAVAPERSARRIALIVDRRIIVDQVDEFAKRIREALADPKRSVCARVAARLRGLSGGHGEPVRVVQLRGGIPRDDSWIGRPDQPTIIASTVDQIGSRLLFRGYGVSESMRPIHAGILARDSLFLLDEVHLATAFEETLRRLESYEEWPERGGTGRSLEVVRMSATLRDDDGTEAFRLAAEDYAHPVLEPRLAAPRPAQLELVKTKRGTTEEVKASNRALIAEVACKKALEAASAGATRVAIVVNRVDTARRAAARLGQHAGADVLLVTGRMRPYDKAAIQKQLASTVAAGVERSADTPTTFVVATSCIEAGADFDFDALVTEVASLDALRQRFGRFNRLGKHPHTWAWILGPNDQLAAQAPKDPVYGEALRNTWAYLSEIAEQGRVDFGLSAFREPEAQRKDALLPTRDEAPLLFPSYLDMWSETRPAPHPDPDPALWLHGKHAKRERDISLVFRADIPVANTLESFEKLIEAASEALEFLPPVADEAVSVAYNEELRTWLAQFGHGRAWRWTADGLEAVDVFDLHVGDTVIVPAACGGLGAGTWDPTSTKPVVDVAEPASFAARKVAKLRIDPQTLPSALRSDAPTPTGSDDPEEFEAAKQACRDWLDSLEDRIEDLVDDEREAWEKLLRELARASKRELDSVTNPSGARIWRVTARPEKRAVEATTEDAVSVFSGLPVPLVEHLEDVEAWASAFASAAGLAPDVASDVALAGLLHDLGKADVRFQALLQGGDPIRAADSTPLAKSQQFGSLAVRKRAEQRSGWPLGLRHELVSLAMLDASPQLREKAKDLDLVRHLVASHHGWCRPWAPTVTDPNPTIVRFSIAGIEVEVSTTALDDAFLNECASRFRRLCRRYGWHGLAYLEALLRLGDHRASARPGPSERPGAKS